MNPSDWVGLVLVTAIAGAVGVFYFARPQVPVLPGGPAQQQPVQQQYVPALPPQGNQDHTQADILGWLQTAQVGIGLVQNLADTLSDGF
jgi:hypothetical protein